MIKWTLYLYVSVFAVPMHSFNIKDIDTLNQCREMANKYKRGVEQGKIGVRVRYACVPELLLRRDYNDKGRQDDSGK